MSAITFTVPFLLKNETRPSADNALVTAFGVAPCAARQFRFDADGTLDASAGNTVRNPPAVGPTMEALIGGAKVDAG